MGARIRFATPADAAAIARIYAPSVEGSVISFEEVAPDAAEYARRIEKVSARHPWIVAESDGVVLGYAYASPHRDRAAYRWSVEVSVYVAEAAWRRGVATALYTSLFNLLDLLGCANVYAGITLPNPPSVGLHEALGFTPVGVYRGIGWKLGAWHDVGWWQLALREKRGTPEEPGALPALLEQRPREVAAALDSGGALLVSPS